MSTLSQFTGGSATRTIVNAFSSGGVNTSTFTASATNNAREVLAGATTAGVLKDVVSITGSGQIPYLAAYSKNTTSRTIRLVVILDGTTVFDATTNAVTSNGGGLAAAGTPGGPSTPIRFNASCLIRVASSLSETDNVAVAYSLL